MSDGGGVRILHPCVITPWQLQIIEPSLYSVPISPYHTLYTLLTLYIDSAVGLRAVRDGAESARMRVNSASCQQQFNPRRSLAPISMAVHALLFPGIF